MSARKMAPQLSEDEIDDVIYFARAGDESELAESLQALAMREEVSRAEILQAAQDEAKSTALHMATGNGHLATVRKMLSVFEQRPKEEKQLFLDAANEHGNTGLHWAALGGHLEVVKELLEQGASPAIANEKNYVPLDLALFNDKAQVAEYFLSFSGQLEMKNEEAGLSKAAEMVQLSSQEEVKDDESTMKD
ncbi:hypothetical protein CDD81_1738 [Ophiocordyceps australis]|uniref:Uncharacterized protein n=1 Tax=Ophiocordyceps australis TaxID=1399860 RepID=A0A2C5YED9_9HYPO|nr:hypothetical protein CDD81_1738 [Ophiocordyceps australis]